MEKQQEWRILGPGEKSQSGDLCGIREDGSPAIARKVEQEYRPLSPEEIIQEGDEYCNKNVGIWAGVSGTIGSCVEDLPYLNFRRPIPSKSATVECPGPDCQMCSGEYCAIHMGDPCDCDVIARHKITDKPIVLERYVIEADGKMRVEHPPFPPVKESLSVEDESSDNSLSFKEISELNQKCSKLFDKAYELQEELAATKLRVEKAEAELNENGKILEHLQTQRDTAYNARDGIAELYTKECELRRTAERERDEAKSKWRELEDKIGYLPEGTHPDEREPRGMTWLQERANWQQERDALRDNETRFREALQNAAKVFREYETIHRAKGTLEADIKAESNALQAERLEAALAGKGESKC